MKGSIGRTSLFVSSALLHAYAGRRLLLALTDRPALAIAFTLAISASALLLPLALIGRRLATSLGRRIVLAWAGMLAMGWFSSLFVFTLLRDGLIQVRVAVQNREFDDVARQNFSLSGSRRVSWPWMQPSHPF